MSVQLHWTLVPGALEINVFDLSTQAEQRLELLVIQKTVRREVPNLKTNNNKNNLIKMFTHLSLTSGPESHRLMNDDADECKNKNNNMRLSTFLNNMHIKKFKPLLYNTCILHDCS